MRSRTATASGLFWAILATALWGATYLGPASVAPVGPAYLILGRYLVFGLLSIGVLIVHRKQAAEIGLRKILIALHLGVIGYVGFYLLFAYSASIGGGTLASIITGVMPAAVTIASNFIRKVVPWRGLAVPVGISTVGLIVVNLQSPEPSTGVSTGDLVFATVLGLLACALWTYFVIVNGIILTRTDGPTINNSTWTALIGVGALFSSFVALPLAWGTDSVSPFSDQPTLIRFIVVSVLLATLGSWCASWSWNRASGRLSTVLLGQLMALETIFGTLLNLIWASRWPTLQEILGTALVTIGVVWCVRVVDRYRTRRAHLPDE